MLMPWGLDKRSWRADCGHQEIRSQDKKLPYIKLGKDKPYCCSKENFCGIHLIISLSLFPGVIESAALVVWLRRQISLKAFLFTDTRQVVEFVKARPLVIIGFFQVLSSRGGRWIFNWWEVPCLGGKWGKERSYSRDNSIHIPHFPMSWFSGETDKMKKEKREAGCGRTS